METSAHHHNKTKVTFDCTVEEKTYIKMLAAKSNMTLGELVLSYVKIDFPKKKKANKATLTAHKEALKGGGTVYKNMNDFWEDMGITKRAKS